MSDTYDPPSWLYRPEVRGAGALKLICFPHAGGNAYEYRDWAKDLPPNIELSAIKLPGRDTRLNEPPLTSIRRAKAVIASQLAPFLDGPFAFFGHSLGAILSYEVARELRAGFDRAPVLLAVSGSRAPQIPNPEPAIYSLPDTEFIAEITGRYEGIPKAVTEHPEMMQLLLPALRGDFQMSDTYVFQPGEQFSFPIACYGGAEDESAPEDALAAWKVQTTGEFVLKQLPGGHFYLRRERRALLDDLIAHLNRVGEQTLA